MISNVCCYSGKILERFTHSESPWLTTRGDLPPTAHSDRVIEKQLIGDYFKKVKDKYAMLDPRDIKTYILDLFDHTCR